MRIVCTYNTIIMLISCAQVNAKDTELMDAIRQALLSSSYVGASNDELVAQMYQKAVNTHRSRELLMLNMEINHLASLAHGVKCNPLKQIIVDDPPDVLKTASGTSTTDRISSIISWQKAIIRTKEQICNFKENLRCDDKTATCRCKVGHAVTGSAGKQYCELVVGQNCGQDYEGDFTSYYDPVKNFTHLTLPPSPPCTLNSSCVQKQFFLLSKCWCNAGKSCKNALGMKEKEVEVILDRNSIIADNFVSNFDQNCDPHFHRDLLNPSEIEQRRTVDRLEKLRTMSDFDIYFCNLRLHLNCTESSKTCDCWRFLAFEKGHCRIKNLLPCQADFDALPFYNQNNGINVGEVTKLLQFKPFRPACIAAAGCQKTKRGHFRCQCHDYTQAGEYCNETKATLTRLVREIWNFPDDDEHLSVFHGFNQHFLTIETRMTLSYENSCYAKNYNQFEYLFGFIFKIFSWPTPALVLDDFKRALGWAKISAESNILLCKGFLGLSCAPIEHRCRCMPGFHWNTKTSHCELDGGSNCEFHPAMHSFMNFQCPLNSACTEDKSGPKKCKCHYGLEGYKCHQKAYELEMTTSEISSQTSPGTSKKPTFSFFKSTEEQGIRRLPSGRAAAASEQKRRIVQLLPSEDGTAPGIVYLNWPPPEWSHHRPNTSIPALPGFDDLLQIILNSMHLPYNATCDPSYDKPELQKRIFDPQFFGYDMTGLRNWFEVETKRQTLDMPRCNGHWYLECDNITMTCQCNVTFDLEPGEGGRCYIKTNDFCLRNDSLLDETFGVVAGKRREPPPCNKGHICDRIRFNLHRCRPFLRDEQPLSEDAAVCVLNMHTLILTLVFSFFVNFRYVLVLPISGW